LLETFGALGLFFHAMTFSVAEGPEVVAFNEKRVQDLPMPSVWFILGGRELSESVVMLSRDHEEIIRPRRRCPQPTARELFVGVEVSGKFGDG
jgi:hypothetical protein